MLRRLTDRPPPRPVRAVLFDLDGTLADSRADLVDSVNAALERHGLRPLAEERIVALVGSGARHLVERSLEAAGGPRTEADALLKTFFDAYRELHLRKTRLYPGAAATLEELHRRGIPSAVVSNKPHEFSASLLRHLGVERLVRTVLGGDSLPVRKPHPGPLYTALKQCGATPATGLVVGDGEQDMLAAREGGIYAAGVTYGLRPVQVLIDTGADALLDRIEEVLQLVS